MNTISNLMEPVSEKIVAIPKDLTPYSFTKSIRGILLAWAMFYGSVLVITFSWQFPWFVAVPITLLSAIIGGYGMLHMGFMGHDGFHFALHENKTISCYMGLLAAIPIAAPICGFAVSHWNHHRYTNGEKDPDVQIFGRFQSFLTRLTFARPFAYYVYYRNIFCLAVGINLPFPYSFPLPYPQMQKMARINLLFPVLSSLLLFFWVTEMPKILWPLTLVLISGSMISGLSPYVEHTSTKQGRGMDTRTSAGWLRDILLMGNNYHLEHHLYPTVPSYNLKKVHEYIKAQGYYNKPRYLTQGYWQAIQTTFRQHPYPRFEQQK